MPVSGYEAVWIFIIYAFFGWCAEVAYAALDTGKFVNRGFLNGAVCPIYGFGVLGVIAALTPLKNNFILLFLGSVILTTIIEFVTGFLLEKLFDNHWWDYSDEHFNIHGYVCLKFSIMWGLACVLIMDVVHPPVYKLLKIIPKTVGMILLISICVILALDFAVTLRSILHFNKRLKLLDEVAERLKAASDELGENIYESVSAVMEKGEEWKENAGNLEIYKDRTEERKQEILRLQNEFKELLERRHFGERRLLKAFPHMKSISHEKALKKWKKYLEEKM